MKVKTLYGEYEVTLEVARYTNGNLAIELNDAEDGTPFATITTNTGDVFKSNNDGITEYALIDTNNCPWAEDFLREYCLGSETGEYIPSGFCLYPIWEINMDMLNSCANESNGYYPITIEVTCTKQLYVKADSEEEALDIAYETYYRDNPEFVVPDGWHYDRDEFLVG
jgi:hypothetical protein